MVHSNISGTPIKIIDNDSKPNHTNRLTCWAGGEGGCFGLFPTGGSNIHSGVGDLVLVYCGSRVAAFLVGLAGAQGSIDHWLHCSLGCRGKNSVKNTFSYRSVQCEAGYCGKALYWCTCTTGHIYINKQFLYEPKMTCLTLN